MDAYAHVRQHFLVHQSIDIPHIYLCCEYELICTFHSRVMGLLLRSSVSDGRPSCNRTVSSSSYYYFFFLFVRRFSPRWFNGLSWNFQGLFSMLVRSGVFFIFSVFTSGRPIWPKRRFRCPAFFSETVKDRVIKFSGMIDRTK